RPRPRGPRAGRRRWWRGPRPARPGSGRRRRRGRGRRPGPGRGGKRGSSWWRGSLRQAREEGGDVGDVLVGKALRLDFHGGVLARAPAVLGERVGEVLGGLPPDLRHVVVGVGVLVAPDAVAAHAGIGQLAAILGISGDVLLREGRGREGEGEGKAGGDRQRS